MTAPDVAAIAKGLSKAQRDAWIRTVLTVNGSEPQRRAFIAGYNGQAVPRNFSRQMHAKHELGLAVRVHLAAEGGE